jgi:small subunit ribosomal protein S6
MRKYELLIILNSEITEEELDNMIEKITQGIKKEGVEIIGVDKWGKRRLAYEIKKQFSCELQALREIEKGLKFIDGIERFMIVVLSDKADLSVSSGPYSSENREEAVL